MSNIGMECERNQNDKPQVLHITTTVDVEVTRHRLKALVDRLEECEADLAPSNIFFHNIDELFDKDGEVKYFKKPVWTDENLSEEFHIPLPHVKYFLKEAHPNFCYENRISRRMWAQENALSRLGYAYKEQKRQFAELKESYDALKSHCESCDKDVKDDSASISVMKSHIDSYKVLVSTLQKDLAVSKERHYSALNEVERAEKIIKEEKKKFRIFFWVTLTLAVTSYLIRLF